MDGIHDLGGMQGFGAVDVEADEPVFHQPWEGRVYGMIGPAMGAAGANTPRFRHAIERMDPAHYLTSPYYEHWLTAAATLLVEAGVVAVGELDAAGTFPLSAPVAPHPLDPLSSGGAEGRFAVGDRVRVRDIHTSGHTRCPRYVRGRVGTVVRVDDAFPVPDVEAATGQRVLERTYGVRFDAAELWGTPEAAAVHVDLYDRYLDPA